MLDYNCDGCDLDVSAIVIPEIVGDLVCNPAAFVVVNLKLVVLVSPSDHVVDLGTHGSSLSAGSPSK